MWLADVFGRERGEHIDFDDIPNLFHRSREMDVLERPDNHIVFGAKGSGKSTTLRALTLRSWLKRAPEARLPFAGVYLPMSYDAANPFALAFTERRTTGLFEHFFVASVFHHLSGQFAGMLPDDASLIAVLNTYLHAQWHQATLSECGMSFLADRHSCLKAVRDSASAKAEDLQLRGRNLSLFDLVSFAEQFAMLPRAGTEWLPTKLGLLLDSFDYYGMLGSVVSPLMQSDSGAPLVIKVAARTLDVNETFGAASTRALEEERDYNLVSLDREVDDHEHFDLVREAICKRVRSLGPLAATALTDNEIIQLLFNGTEEDPDDITSFLSFCRLSSGNVLAVILLLERAAELQRQREKVIPRDLEPLLREHRLRAVNDASVAYWEFEIGVRVPQRKLEAAVFCDAALAAARTAHPTNSRSPRFVLESTPEKSLLAAMLATRLLIAAEPNVNRRIQAGHPLSGVLTFELNRTLLPKHNLLPLAGPEVVLDRKSFGNMFRKALQTARPYLSPHSSHSQKELFRPDFTVFVSMPFDPAKKDRTSVVRKAINRIYKEKTGRAGGEGTSYTDIHFIPHVGPFRREIPSYIRDATYVVADISDIGASPERVPGVFYEIGVAIGEKKPFALFYNSRFRSKTPKFRVEFLPALLRGQTIVVWDEGRQNFHELYKRIHEKLAAYNGVYDAEDQPATADQAPPSGRYAYLSFQPRNSAAGDWFASLVRRLFPELQIATAKDWQQEDLGLIRETIGRAELCVIDCTGGINSQAVELGVAASTGAKRALEVWDANQPSVNPVPMFQGKKWSWSDLGSEDQRYALGALRDVARATNLGARQP